MTNQTLSTNNPCVLSKETIEYLDMILGLFATQAPETEHQWGFLAALVELSTDLGQRQDVEPYMTCNTILHQRELQLARRANDQLKLALMPPASLRVN